MMSSKTTWTTGVTAVPRCCIHSDCIKMDSDHILDTHFQRRINNLWQNNMLFTPGKEKNKIQYRFMAIWPDVTPVNLLQIYIKKKKKKSNLSSH